MKDIKLGVKPDVTGLKDAVHVAVIAVTAGSGLQPGQHVTIKRGVASACLPAAAHAIVDPFLLSPVASGHVCYACLMPGMVTGMRHQWECAVVDMPVCENTRIREYDADELVTGDWLEKFAVEQLGCTYREMMDHISEWLSSGMPYIESGSDKMRETWYANEKKFWPMWSLATGQPIPDGVAGDSPYSCSC